MLYKISLESIALVCKKYISYFVTLFICTYFYKKRQKQSGRYSSSNINPKVTLTLRIWLVLILSQIGYTCIIVQIVWNYNQKFLQILHVYSFYSTYVCLTAIINSKYESYISALIIVIAVAV